MATQDREAVKILAIAVGVREAARQLNLNEDTVCSWAKRGQWFKQKPQPPSNAIDLQALQAKPSQALAEALAEDGKETKLSLSRAARRTAKSVEMMDGEDIYASADKFKHVVGAASQLYGWEAKVEKESDLHINVLANQALIINQAFGQNPEHTGE